MDGKLHRATSAIGIGDAVAAGINCEVVKADEVFVKNTDLATGDNLGIIKAKSFGIKVNASGELYISKAEINSEVKPGLVNCLPIVPSNQHAATFYGLAKAAGDITQSASSNAVGTYTADAKAAIQTMLGVPGDVQINGTSIISNGVANIPVATGTVFGVVKAVSTNGVFSESGTLYIGKASTDQVKGGSNNYRPIVPSNQHESVFYGLAKAAGDTTMASSSNAVGSYTTEAKAAIHTMLGIDPASIAAQVDIPLVETVSGTTPTS